MWHTCRVRSWCLCRWSSSSLNTNITTSVSPCRATTHCGSPVPLTTPSHYAGRLTTSRWWRPALSQWSPTHWLACSLCTTSTRLAGARTVPICPTATRQHGYSWTGPDQSRFQHKANMWNWLWKAQTPSLSRWYFVITPSWKGCIAHKLLKKFRMNVTLVTLFEAELHRRFYLKESNQDWLLNPYKGQKSLYEGFWARNTQDNKTATKKLHLFRIFPASDTWSGHTILHPSLICIYENFAKK